MTPFPSLGFERRMPGESRRGPLSPPTPRERELARELRRDLDELAVSIGPRNVSFPEAYRRAEAMLASALEEAGLAVERERFDADGHSCANLVAEVRGSGDRADEILLLGAHYDSVRDCPGANDNGTGAVAVLALARRLALGRFERTIRFVLFANEEPPYFQTEQMGSMVHARRCAERGEDVAGFLNLETMGCFLDEPGSQKYPPLVGLGMPKTGDFIAFVANRRSGAFARKAIAAFRERATVPSEGLIGPNWMPWIDASDHGSFWEFGFPAVLVTDTAPLRYAHYHTLDDTVDKVDFDRLARVVAGIEDAARDLAGELDA